VGCISEHAFKECSTSSSQLVGLVIAIAYLQDYKAAQKVAADKEAQFLPKVPTAAAAAAAASKGGTGSHSTATAAATAAAVDHGSTEADIESQALLQEQKLQQARAMENTIAFQEALIEERDHGIAGACGV
jgi:syntaxin 7